jgi:flavin-dependent dehydrogenase
MKNDNLLNVAHFDVLIMGGGSSGVSAGLSLLKNGNISVGLIEGGQYDEERIGKSLSTQVTPLLQYLNVWDEFSQSHCLVEFSSFAAWGNKNLRPLDSFNSPKLKGWNIDPIEFDAQLANIFAQRGGNLMLNTKVVLCVNHLTNQWEITVKEANGETKIITCKYLIDASGRRGLLRTNSHLSLSVYDRLVGVCCIGQLPEGKEMKVISQIEACEYGWWHISTLSGNRVSVALMTDPDIICQLQVSKIEIWKSLLCQLDILGEQMKDVIFNEIPYSFPCFSSFLKKMGGDNWISVGDAVASFDPLCSSGILRAIDSGIHGALVAIDFLVAEGKNNLLEAYINSIHKEFSKYLQSQWQYYQRENRWPNAVFWERRRAVIGISGDAIIKETYFYEHSLDRKITHLNAHELQSLWSLCKPAMNLQQVAKAFIQLHAHVVEKKVMLALQELINKEAIKLVEQDSELNSIMHPYAMMEA